MNVAQSTKNGRKLIITAESKDGKAYIRIIGRIANYNENNSKDFQNKVDELLKSHKEAIVYINSEGGSVFESVEITNQLKRFDKVIVQVGALAASAATYITSSFHTIVSRNSQLMIHKPMMGTYGNVDAIKRDLKLLQNTTEDYLRIYSEKTGKTPAEIDDMWGGGDYWMSAQEAKDEGFVDEITDQEDVITAEDKTVLEACGAPIVPMPKLTKITNTKTTKIMNKEELIAFLGLSADATDEQIEAAKRQLKVDALKQRELEVAAKAKQENELKDKANALVDAAIADKKITADQKETWLKLALADYDDAKKALDAMISKEKISAQLKLSNPEAGASERANWTLEDYLEKDPEAYEKLKAENPQLAEKLEAEYFNK